MSNPSKVAFEWTMSFGQLAQVISIVLAGAAVYYGLDSRVSKLEEKSLQVGVAIQKLETGMAELAKANSAAIEKFQTQANSRMDVFSSNLTTISVSVAKTEANVESLIRNSVRQ